MKKSIIECNNWDNQCDSIYDKSNNKYKMKTKNINRRQKPDLVWWKCDLSDDFIQGWLE